MTKTHRHHEDRRLRRKTAAFRLKHDVGKALRWSAPEERETDTGALRARLAADLLPHASGAGADGDVLERFFEWKKEEGSMFGSDEPELRTVEAAVAAIAAARDQLQSLSSSFSSLLALDDACLEASRACTAFYRRIAVEDGPEIVRAPGASGVTRRRGGGGGGR